MPSKLPEGLEKAFQHLIDGLIRMHIEEAKKPTLFDLCRQARTNSPDGKITLTIKHEKIKDAK